MQEQYEIAEAARQFIEQYGLVKQYVAQRCNIPTTRLSSWLHHHYAMTEKQLAAISAFMTDYKRRMS